MSSLPSATVINLSDTNPAAPSGFRNAKFVASAPYNNTVLINGVSTSVTERDVDAYVPNIGGVNAQTVTSYTILASDRGKMVTFNNSSAQAVTLDSTLANDFDVVIVNIGTGAVTLTPSSGQIDGAANFVLTTNQGIWIFFDGTNWRTVRGISSGTSLNGVNAQTASYLAVSGDAGKLISMNGSSLTLTLPASPPSATWMILVENRNSTDLTISRNGLNIDGAASNLTLHQNQGTVIFTDGSNYFTSRGNPNVQEDNITLADVTTDNVSTTKHGFAPKAPNDGTKFLDGTGAYSTPNAGNIAGGFAWGGDGSDGAQTYDGTTTILGMAPSSSTYTLTRDIFCSSITVNSGVTIKTNNYAIYCSGTLTNSGTIQNNGAAGAAGNNAGSSTAGGASSGTAAAGALTAAHYARNVSSVGGTAGGNGGTTTGTQAPSANLGNTSVAGPIASGAAGATGASGGQGGTGTSGAGGAVRAGGAGASVTLAGVLGNKALAADLGAFRPSGNTTFIVYTYPNGGNGGSAGGGGGGGDGTNSGGGGGGGGGEGGGAGWLGIFAKNIVNAGTGIISANGGTGGNGGNGFTPTAGNTGGGGGGAGGSGGQGGQLTLVYQTLTNNGTIQANGGSGGSGGAKGSPHGTGTDNATAGAGGGTGPAGMTLEIVC